MALYGPQKIEHRVKNYLWQLFGRSVTVNLRVRSGIHRLLIHAFEPPPSFWGVLVEDDIWVYTALNKTTSLETYVAEWDFQGDLHRADSPDLRDIVRSVARWILDKRIAIYLRD